MGEKNRKFRELRVKVALKNDIGKGYIRIDPNIVKEMDVHSGDVIEIIHPSSNKRTVAIFWGGYKEDKGTRFLRVDLRIGPDD